MGILKKLFGAGRSSIFEEIDRLERKLGTLQRQADQAIVDYCDEGAEIMRETERRMAAVVAKSGTRVAKIEGDAQDPEGRACDLILDHAAAEAELKAIEKASQDQLEAIRLKYEAKQSRIEVEAQVCYAQLLELQRSV